MEAVAEARDHPKQPLLHCRPDATSARALYSVSSVPSTPATPTTPTPPTTSAIAKLSYPSTEATYQIVEQPLEGHAPCRALGVPRGGDGVGCHPLLAKQPLLLDGQDYAVVMVLPKISALPDQDIENPYELSRRIFSRDIYCEHGNAADQRRLLCVDDDDVHPEYDPRLDTLRGKATVSNKTYQRVLRNLILDVLHKSGFQADSFHSVDEDETFVLVRLDRAGTAIRRLAQRNGISKRIKIEAYEQGLPQGSQLPQSLLGKTHGTYQREYLAYNIEVDSIIEPFTRIEEVRFINLHLRSRFDFGELAQQNVVLKYFPIADSASVLRLNDLWIRPWWPLPQASHARELQPYFGEQITFFFLWFGYYVRSLGVFSLAGLIMGTGMLDALSNSLPSQDTGIPGVTVDNVLSTIAKYMFAFVSVVWASLFNKFFARQSHRWAQEWGMQASSPNEYLFLARKFLSPEFFGDTRIPFEEVREMFSPGWKPEPFGVNVTGLYHLLHSGSNGDGDLGGRNGVCSYGCFPEYCWDVNGVRSCRTNCEEMVWMYLLTFFLVHMACSIAFVCIPYIIAYFTVVSEVKSAYNESWGDLLRRWIHGGQLLDNDGLSVESPTVSGARYTWLQLQAKCFDVAEYTYFSWGGSETEDFMELAIGFSILQCFSILCPIMPCVAFLCYLVEYRLMAIRMTNVTCRPFPFSAHDIGEWRTIFQTISAIAMFTIVWIMALRSDGKQLFLSLQSIEFTENPSHLWLFDVAMVQGTLFALHGAIQMLIPDVPEDVVVVDDIHNLQHESLLRSTGVQRVVIEIPSHELRDLDTVHKDIISSSSDSEDQETSTLQPHTRGINNSGLDDEVTDDEAPSEVSSSTCFLKCMG